jgi:hypothetical protein
MSRNDDGRRFEARDLLLYPWSVVVWGAGLGWLGFLAVSARSCGSPAAACA